MKRHLKASLGLGNSNGWWRPPNIRPIDAENGSPNRVNGNGQLELESNRSDVAEAPQKSFEPEAVAEAMSSPKKERRGGSKERKESTSSAVTAPAEEVQEGRRRKSAQRGVPRRSSNGQQSAKENVAERLTTANNNRNSNAEPAEAVKPKSRRGRVPKQVNGSKKPRENGSVRDGESSDEEGSHETGEATQAPRNIEPLVPEYQPGDLLWSKISKNPFWPCMVIEDPINNKYYQRKGKQLIYYVQYFGEQVKHGWTQNRKRVVPYQGLEAFKEYVSQQITKSKALVKFFTVGPQKSTDSKSNWVQALKEVEEARRCESIPMRYTEFRFAFYPGGQKRNKAPPPPPPVRKSSSPEV